MANGFQLFLYTVDEYRRFADYLTISNPTGLPNGYTEADYIGIQVRLMLLRKYYSNSIKENVNFRKLISEAIKEFPNKIHELQALYTEFDNIETQQIEHLLTDGTKLNIYTTIEDSVYGLYLHADEDKITRLNKTTESIRFFCTKKYILDIETIIFRLYDILADCDVKTCIYTGEARAPMVYLGDKNKKSQFVSGSPYWSNIYGHDAADDDMRKILQETDPKELKILETCNSFLNLLLEDKVNTKELKKLIHPATRKAWGSFKEVQNMVCSISNIGISSKVRYNKNRDTAYVFVYPNVENPFLISTPHIHSDGYEIALGKWFGRWKIYSFGGHLDSIYKTKNDN